MSQRLTFYPYTVVTIAQTVKWIAKKNLWTIIPVENPDAADLYGRLQHVLFMIRMMEEWSRDAHGLDKRERAQRVAKAGRSIGWMLREIELVARESGVTTWNNEESLDAIRRDVSQLEGIPFN